jgi:uncharacterized protein with HEPN domain
MRDERAFLMDMLQSAEQARGYISGITYEEFLNDPAKVDAVLYRIIVIGEAAHKISDTMRATLPQLPFETMWRMRNRITHGYWNVDSRIVWDTATVSLNELIEVLKGLLRP